MSKKVSGSVGFDTGQRIQSLCVIDLRNLELTPQYVKIRFGYLLNQSKPGNHLQELYIESHAQNRSLCVANCLSKYLDMTGDLRSDNNLFKFVYIHHKTI